ncbi:MAG: hypothetical protein ACE5OS_14205, partial [Anaerolineae bacterium]
AEVPEWLKEAAPPAAEPAPEEAAPPLVGAPPPVVTEAPEWLREIVPEKKEAAPETALPVPPLVEFPAEVETAEAPEWLAELQPESVPPSAPVVPVFEGTPPPVPPEPEIGVAEVPGLARAEIPDWLEGIRPREEAAEAVTEEAPLETEGLLEGLRGVLPPALAVEVPTVRESALPAETREASLARAQLLQSLLSRPAEMPQPEVRRPGVTMTERLQRLAVAAVLLVPIVGILMWPHVVLESEFPTLTQPDTSRAETLYNVVEGVSSEATVLVAFEYGPPEADELTLVAAPILQHLLDRGVHIFPVSTRPEGQAMAEGLLSHIGAPEEQCTPPVYRPGGATGVSQLLVGTDTRPSLILVLAAQPAPLRWWVEQAHARGEGTLPVVAGVSAALEAAASPYLDANAGQLRGTISGLSGAAAYERRRGMEGEATRRLNTLAAGHVAIVGLILIGAVIYPLVGSRRKEE